MTKGYLSRSSPGAVPNTNPAGISEQVSRPRGRGERDKQDTVIGLIVEGRNGRMMPRSSYVTAYSKSLEGRVFQGGFKNFSRAAKTIPFKDTSKESAEHITPLVPASTLKILTHHMMNGWQKTYLNDGPNATLLLFPPPLTPTRLLRNPSAKLSTLCGIPYEDYCIVSVVHHILG